MEKLQQWLSIWELTRASGITGYLLLFLSTVFGLISSMDFIHNKWKKFFSIGHQYAGWMGFLVCLFHGMILYYNHYDPFTWKEIFLPFVARYSWFWSGIGTLSLYFMVIVLLSSDLINKLGKRLWKTLHYFAFGAYGFALLHGIFLGTDTREWWVIMLYASTSAIVLSLIIIRVLAISIKKERKVTQS